LDEYKATLKLRRQQQQQQDAAESTQTSLSNVQLASAAAGDTVELRDDETADAGTAASAAAAAADNDDNEQRQYVKRYTNTISQTIYPIDLSIRCSEKNRLYFPLYLQIICIIYFAKKCSQQEVRDISVHYTHTLTPTHLHDNIIAVYTDINAVTRKPILAPKTSGTVQA